jgi:S1-C subfamily serine protease
VAVHKIQGVANLPTVKLGRSADLKVGDDVVAIGNALALEGGPTVTKGIVSALNRKLPDTSLNNLIQTDTAINAGNSGGPLVNALGQVVGINTAVIQNSGGREVQNIGFAIAIDAARPVVDSLGAGKGQVTSRAYLGLGPQDADGGALVATVGSGDPADQAGIRSGDVITAVDGQKVSGARDLVNKIRAHKPGDKVELTYRRNGQEQKTTATLGSRQVSNGAG